MKIFGIGTDIVNIKRMEKSIKKNGDRFKKRIFSKNEIIYCEKSAPPKTNFCGGRSKPPGEGLDEEIGSGLRVATLHHPLSASSEGGMVQRRPPRFARRPPPALWRNHRCEPVARSCRVRWPRRVGPGRGGAGRGVGGA